MEITINGEIRVMRLTLGALASLEAELGVSSLVGLVERFEGATFSTGDVLALLRAGLAGGGSPMSTEALGAADVAGGPMAAAKAAAELLARAFAQPGG